MNVLRDIGVVTSILNSIQAPLAARTTVKYLVRPNRPEHTEYYLAALRNMMDDLNGRVTLPNGTVLTKSNLKSELLKAPDEAYNFKKFNSPSAGYVGYNGAPLDYDNIYNRTVNLPVLSESQGHTFVMNRGNMIDNNLRPYLHEFGHFKNWATDPLRRTRMAMTVPVDKDAPLVAGIGGSIGTPISLAAPSISGVASLADGLVSNAPTLSEEFMASYNGYKALRNVGAPWAVKREYLGSMVPAYWSYMSNALPKVL